MCFHFESKRNGFPNTDVSRKIKMTNFNQTLLPVSSSRKHNTASLYPSRQKNGQHLIIQVSAQHIINIGQGIQTQKQEKYFKLIFYR